jgi:hypothetical protein
MEKRRGASLMAVQVGVIGGQRSCSVGRENRVSRK